MRYKSLFIIIVSVLLTTFASCGGGPANNGNAGSNANKTVANTPPANSNNPVETTKKPVAETSNNAPTVAPVIQAYYEALRKKDDSALQNVLSGAYFAKIAADMKRKKATGMAAYLAEYDPPPAKPVDVRNEKITGDKAVAEVKGGAYLDWAGVGFINEGGKWKLSGDSPDIQNVTSQPNPNKAK